MSMTTIMDLRNKRASLWEQTKSFLETHRNENGIVDAASVEQYDRMTADVQALSAEIKRLEDQMALDAQLSAPTSAPVQMKPMARKDNVKPTATEEYSKAFWDAIRSEMRTIDVHNAFPSVKTMKADSPCPMTLCACKGNIYSSFRYYTAQQKR